MYINTITIIYQYITCLCLAGDDGFDLERSARPSGQGRPGRSTAGRSNSTNLKDIKSAKRLRV